jgi:hypothetical protein
LVFKTDEVKPFIAFCQEMKQKHEFIKHTIEFAYDDGTFHFLFIDSDRTIEDEKNTFDHSSEWIHSGVLTGIPCEDIESIVDAWSEEIKPTEEQVELKRERLRTGKQRSDERFEREKTQWEKKEKQNVYSASVEPRFRTETKVKYQLPPNLTKAKVLEIIQNLNTSGEVIIPVFILKDEINPKLHRDDMISIHLRLERSKVKVEIFENLMYAIKGMMD